MTLNNKQEYDDLCEELRKYCDYYYNKNTSLIPDVEYDKKYRILVDMEKNHPEWVDDRSPTKFVGYKATGALSKVKHSSKLYSLDNLFTIESLDKFLFNCERTLHMPSLEYSVEPKYDGLTVVAIYEQGKLVDLVTRGDGEEGERVYHNAPYILGLPLSLKEEATIMVKGEVVMTFEDFNLYNEWYHSKGMKTLSNPRNGASGILRRLKGDGKTWLTFIPYDIMENKWSNSKLILSQGIMFSRLAKLGFSNLYNVASCLHQQQEVENGRLFLAENINIAKQKVAMIYENRGKLPFPIDGAVIKIFDFNKRYSLGYTDRAPKGAIAYKFPPEEVISKLLNIDLQVGKIGIITPVARISPVDVNGVTVSNVTLHNEAFIKKLDLRIGDKIVITRRGDVIPHIEYVLYDQRDKDLPVWEMPDTCPSCHEPIIKEKSYCVCTNGVKCPSQKLYRFSHFCSKQAMDIRGLAENTLKTLIDLKLIDKLKDIYSLTKVMMIAIPGMGETSIQNLLDSIKASMNPPLHKFIYSLCIESVGVVMAKSLAKHFKTISRFINTDINELMGIRDVGASTAYQIMEYLRTNKKDIDELIKIVKPTSEIDKLGKLSGKTICFTGKFLHSRKYLEEIIEGLGGEVINGVGTKLNYLIVGTSPSSKLDKAKKLNIETHDEDWVLSLQ